MKLVVQDFLKTERLHELDTDSGDVTPAEGRERREARGYYAKLGRTPVVFYGASGKLHLRAGDHVAPLAGAKVELSGEGLRTLKVSRDEQVILSVQYPNPVNPPMELDLSMAEEEDFDLGLFVKNVTSSVKRRELMLAKWGAS
ncbi:MAG: hypothetical protein IPG04_07100 [Polyangiaceae bacterium]|nr:hypothetical protein [Polyangiaceae bacterium]